MKNTEFEVFEVICFLVMLITDTQVYTNTHRPTAENITFEFKGFPTIKIHQNHHFENLTQKQCILNLIWVRESKKRCTKKDLSDCNKISYAKTFRPNLEMIKIWCRMNE